MKEYMMIFRNEEKEGEMPSPEYMRTMMQKWQDWIVGIAKQGKYAGTNRLLSEGKTIGPNNVITDGPYMEVKEMVGGYLIVKANSFEDAMELAKSCPNMLYGGKEEVRSVMQIDDDPNSKTFLQGI